MDLIQHAQVLPWSVDAAFFLQLLWQFARTAGLLAMFGVSYAGLHRLLSNRSLIWPKGMHQQVEPAGQTQNGREWANRAETYPKEEVFNEA